MMIRRQSVQKVPKPLKTQRNQKASGLYSDCCSRVGCDYQVDIPKCKGVRYKSDEEDKKVKEIRVWSPEKQPSDQELSEYLVYASKYDYPPELALILLHWHEYNIKHAMDDIPNYSPVLNKWTKFEIRKFLKCIDSKPRKNFVEAKKSMPGRPMGEICQLYYAIAAPFKAPTRTKSHSELIEQCFARAVRMGHITNRGSFSYGSVPFPPRSTPSNAVINSRKPGEAEDPLEREFELHLVSLVGMSKTRRLLGRRILFTPYPLPITTVGPTGPDVRTTTDATSDPSSLTRSHPNPSSRSVIDGGTQYPLLPSFIGVDYQTGSNSSGASSQLGSESTSHIPTPPRYSLPPGVHYDHDEFLAFLSTTEQQLQREREQVLTCSGNLDVELLEQIHELDARAISLLNETELLKPACGFPEISYRWTKTELALVLTAMSRYGDDFATIARTIGSKTEGFIRDFYNQCRDQFPLDEIIRHAQNNVESGQNHQPEDGVLKPELQLNNHQSPDSPVERISNDTNVIIPNGLPQHTRQQPHSPSRVTVSKPEEQEDEKANSRLVSHPADRELQVSECGNSMLSVAADSDRDESRDRSPSSSTSSHQSPPSKRPNRSCERGSSGVTRGRPRGRGRARGRARGRPGRGRMGAAAV